MVNEERRSSYDTLVQKVREWKGLEALSLQLTDNRNPEGQSTARVNIRGKYDIPGDVSDERVRDKAVSEFVESREDTVRYLGENLEDILGSVPYQKLRDGVSDKLPAMGLSPDPEKGEDSMRHLAYLQAKSVLARFVKGEEKKGDESQLMEIAVENAVLKAQESLLEKGYDPRKNSQLFGLALQAAEQEAYQETDRESLIKEAKKYLDKAKAEFAGSFEAPHDMDNYAKDLIRSYAEKRPEEVALALASLSD